MAGIIVVFPKPDDANAIRSLLVRNGYDSVFSCTTGARAITLADTLGEGVIISGYRMPDMSYTDLLDNIGDRFEMLLVASRQKVLEDETGVAIVEMPIKVRDFLNSIEMIQHNVLAKYSRKRKPSPPKRSMEEQSVVNDAKAVLMEKNNMTENEAHRYIQKHAMNSGRTMVETAQSILAIMYKE